MTTKQIAEALGKPEQTVRNWVRALASKMDVIKFKLDASSPMNPADYDLDETCAIIERGMGKNASSLYRENAKHNGQMSKVPMANAQGDVVTRSDLADFGRAIVGEMMKQLLPLIQRPALSDIVQDYFTVKGYANKVGVQITYSEAVMIGRAAVKLSREMGKEVRKADDERFGQVNSYHASVLAEVFRS